MTLILDKDNPLATKVQYIPRHGGALPARIICTDLRDDTPIVAAVSNEDGTSEFIMWFKINGRSRGEPRLINAPVTHKQWVNVFKRKSDGIFTGHVHSTRAVADDDKCNNEWIRIACIEMEFKEGDGL